jgi:hypothetical protein
LSKENAHDGSGGKGDLMDNFEMQERIDLCERLERAEKALLESELDMTDDQIRERLELVCRLLSTEKELAENGWFQQRRRKRLPLTRREHYQMSGKGFMNIDETERYWDSDEGQMLIEEAHGQALIEKSRRDEGTFCYPENNKSWKT